jgi:hypothetical protein
MKSDFEIERAYENGKLDDLTIEELEKLDRILKQKTIYKNYGQPETPKPKITDTGSRKMENNDSDRYFNYFCNRYDLNKSMSYEQFAMQEFYENTDSDSSCPADISSWSPNDVYANIIFRGVYKISELYKICVPGLDVRQGEGGKVQIKVMSKRTPQKNLGDCECMSCASDSYSTYTLTLARNGDYAILCGMDEFKVGDSYRDSVVKSMYDGMAEAVDAEIYAELETATPGFTETLGNALACTASISGSCCTDTSFQDLYNAIEALSADMREAGYKPDYMILSPSVARILKSLDSNQVPAWAEKEFVFSNGELVKAGGLKVIEYSGANSCTDATGETVAIIIDSSRAVGLAWGQRPKIETQRQPECDSTKVVANAYWKAGELDTNGIGHVVNP